MKKSFLSIIALTFLVAPVATAYEASAQGRPEIRREMREDRRELRQDRRENRREVRQDRRELRQDRRQAARPAWLRNGGRYAGNRQYVGDYRRYGLRAPGRGQRWVRYNDNYILVTVASGLIGAIIASR